MAIADQTQDGYFYLFNSNEINQPMQSCRFVILERPLQIDAWGLEPDEFICVYRVKSGTECGCPTNLAKPYLDHCKEPVCLSCECDMITIEDPGEYILAKSGDVIGNPSITGRYIARCC